MPTQPLTGAWSFRQHNTTEWLPANVPGGVHTDLLALGKIPDPFVADNEKKVQWITEVDWEYRRAFKPLSPWERGRGEGATRHFLVCDGLDTLAEVSLNGQLLGKTDNMYRQWRWDVSDQLQPGENEISILFRAPVAFAREREAQSRTYSVTAAIPGGPHLRKAPCQWGWDWGPQLPPIGIWKDIRLESYAAARLENVHVRQQHENMKNSFQL